MLDTSSIRMNQKLTIWHKGARATILKALSVVYFGQLSIRELYEQDAESAVMEFGQANVGQPHVSIDVHHPDFYVRLLKGGSIGGAEAYIDKLWDTSDLTTLVEIMAKNQAMLDEIEAKSGWWTRQATKVGHWLKRNTIDQAKNNILAHYDLGNDLYETFLDKDMLYSSALYVDENETLEQAQHQKMARLCQQLALTADDHVIEIGTGWGAMAIYMASHYGCHVTTTTISDEQYRYAKARIEEQGLTDRITLLKQDYRLLEGQYDKLVSIEMIEAVGKQYLPSYITQCQQLLKPNGIMALQAITITDQRFDYYGRNVDFIQKYIFPGGFLPSVTVLANAATQNTDFVIRDLHDFGDDYGKTLREWRKRFEAQLPRVKTLGYDERFIRLWRFYFCYCEGGFKARSISVIHMTLTRS
ncbi:SAM-dependent methyltransferase [Vibrio palustris]|uniref:Cyclopropane-fatty-acyl-phospholipid synthase n=1 Tax=Vibrio palustris TaxID=1918946 RepID=A0A1R4B313_9VIBR|nr:cyclopropane-fatty-acyl-phospholipid synthase family protein [Vibrio palustris]SJL83310.1 Cyclopropane-fatty-acyl-phospholipid synthase [Vibrio palustris]